MEIREKPIILFGCGAIGRKILEFLGIELVDCFVDNSVETNSRNTINNIKVISFSEYKTIYNKYITVIATNRISEKQIAEQLLNNNIKGFLFWEEIAGIFNNDIDLSFQKEHLADRNDKWIEKTLCFIKKQLPIIQDKNSEVEFYLIDSFEISHFLPIYDALKKKGVKVQFIAEPSPINSANMWFDYQEATCLLREKNIDYCTLRNPKAKVAFTTQFAKNLKYYDGIKCQMSYGVAVMKEKAFQLKKETAIYFDYIFTHGELYKNILTQWIPPSHVIDMSYPRYLNEFELKISKEEILNELKIKTDKPIVTYFPTWDEYSSIQEYEKTINLLRNNFYVISKPHHCIWRSNDKMGALSRCSDLVLDGKFDLYKIAQITDCAICDAKSGVSTELAFLNRDIHIILLYCNLINEDFYIDMDKFAYGVKHPIELYGAVRKLINNDEKIYSRKNMVDKMYSPNIQDGVDRALKKICEIIAR